MGACSVRVHNPAIAGAERSAPDPSRSWAMRLHAPERSRSAAAAALLLSRRCGAGAPRAGAAAPRTRSTSRSAAARRSPRNRLAATTARLARDRLAARTTGAGGRWATTGAGELDERLPARARCGSPTRSRPTPVWRSRAERWQAGLAGQASNTTTHDVGFMIFDSFGNGYRLTGDDALPPGRCCEAAGSLATRYSHARSARSARGTAGSWRYPVIVDNMMNLELLFWAAEHGGQARLARHRGRPRADHRAATTCGRTAARTTSSTTTRRRARCGARARTRARPAASTWARGQAWAIHGFATAYRETRGRRGCSTPRAASPTGSPPGCPPTASPTGTSARRIRRAARQLGGGDRGLRAARARAARARRRRRARALPRRGARDPDLALLAGVPVAGDAAARPCSCTAPPTRRRAARTRGLIYGDYYFQQALLRLRRITPAAPPWPVAGVIASGSDGNVAANAVDGSLGDALVGRRRRRSGCGSTSASRARSRRSRSPSTAATRARRGSTSRRPPTARRGRRSTACCRAAPRSSARPTTCPTRRRATSSSSATARRARRGTRSPRSRCPRARADRAQAAAASSRRGGQRRLGDLEAAVDVVVGMCASDVAPAGGGRNAARGDFVVCCRLRSGADGRRPSRARSGRATALRRAVCEALGELRARADAELRVGVRQVRLDGAHGDEQRARDLLVGVALRPPARPRAAPSRVSSPLALGRRAPTRASSERARSAQPGEPSASKAAAAALERRRAPRPTSGAAAAPGRG